MEKSQYQKEEKEILILTSDVGIGAGKTGNSWASSKFFLAYVDLASNELKKGDGRVNWLISEEEKKEHGCSWPYYFKGGVIYRLKVRELIDKTVPEGRLPSFYNRFMVVDVIEENVHNNELLAILAEYRKPVKIADQVLGEFELDKNFNQFEGTINWLEENISVFLEVNVDNKDSWTKAMNVLRTLFEQQKQKDSELRAYAAEQLTDLANDWIQDDNTLEISKEDFARRIGLSELVVTSEGDYNAYYYDDDMFLGHVVTVSGNIDKGIEFATIEG